MRRRATSRRSGIAGRAVLALGLLIALPLAASAQSGGDYTIVRSVISGGGQAVSGGPYTVVGTLGQTDLGTVEGVEFTVGAGYWGGGNLIPTAVPEDPDLDDAVPAMLRSFPAYPNPFNPMTTLAFELPRAMAVDLTVHDVTGRVVRRLLDRTFLPAGRHERIWDGRDGDGAAVASGAYLFRLVTDAGTETRQMMLIK